VINKGFVRTVAIVTGLALLSLGLTVAADERSALEVVERARDMWRGETFHAVVSIEETRGGRTEFQRLEVWAEGDERALGRILEPEEEAGSGYLFLSAEESEELWYYDSRADEVIPIPAAMMYEGLLGADTGLEALFHGTVAEHYEVSYSEQELADGYLVELRPLSGAPVVHGLVVLTIGKDFVITRIDYYDERDSVVRRAYAEELMELEDRVVPKVWVVEENADRTVITYEELSIDEPLPEDIFTLENLTQP